jgi:hypothetical protein
MWQTPKLQINKLNVMPWLITTRAVELLWQPLLKVNIEVLVNNSNVADKNNNVSFEDLDIHYH